MFSDLRKIEQNMDNVLLYYDFYNSDNTDFNPIIMKDGAVTVMFRIGGMDYEGISEEDRDQLSYYIRGACEQLGPGFTLDNYFVRGPAKFIELKENKNSPEIINYIQKKKEDFWRERCANALENELLFCLRYFKIGRASCRERV